MEIFRKNKVFLTGFLVIASGFFVKNYFEDLNEDVQSLHLFLQVKNPFSQTRESITLHVLVPHDSQLQKGGGKMLYGQQTRWVTSIEQIAAQEEKKFVVDFAVLPLDRNTQFLPTQFTSSSPEFTLPAWFTAKHAAPQVTAGISNIPQLENLLPFMGEDQQLAISLIEALTDLKALAQQEIKARLMLGLCGEDMLFYCYAVQQHKDNRWEWSGPSHPLFVIQIIHNLSQMQPPIFVNTRGLQIQSIVFKLQ
ncbi:MAG: hypothetical protein AAGB12_10480 [Pseudomonadota bacterium]